MLHLLEFSTWWNLSTSQHNMLEEISSEVLNTESSSSPPASSVHSCGFSSSAHLTGFQGVWVWILWWPGEKLISMVSEPLLCSLEIFSGSLSVWKVQNRVRNLRHNNRISPNPPWAYVLCCKLTASGHFKGFILWSDHFNSIWMYLLDNCPKRTEQRIRILWSLNNF